MIGGVSHSSMSRCEQLGGADRRAMRCPQSTSFARSLRLAAW